MARTRIKTHLFQSPAIYGWHGPVSQLTYSTALLSRDGKDQYQYSLISLSCYPGMARTSIKTHLFHCPAIQGWQGPVSKLTYFTALLSRDGKDQYQNSLISLSCYPGMARTSIKTHLFHCPAIQGWQGSVSKLTYFTVLLSRDGKDQYQNSLIPLPCYPGMARTSIKTHLFHCPAIQGWQGPVLQLTYFTTLLSRDGKDQYHNSLISPPCYPGMARTSIATYFTTLLSRDGQDQYCNLFHRPAVQGWLGPVSQLIYVTTLLSGNGYNQSHTSLISPTC